MFSNLKEIRKNKNISALELAKLIGLKTINAYYKKENETIKFSLKEAKIISDYLKMSIDDVFFKN